MLIFFIIPPIREFTKMFGFYSTLIIPIHIVISSSFAYATIHNNCALITTANNNRLYVLDPFSKTQTHTINWLALEYTNAQRARVTFSRRCDAFRGPWFLHQSPRARTYLTRTNPFCVFSAQESATHKPPPSRTQSIRSDAAASPTRWTIHIHTRAQKHLKQLYIREQTLSSYHECVCVRV